MRAHRLAGVALAAVMLLATLLANPLAMSAQESSVVGNTYYSPTYGYSLSWDVSWQVSEEITEEGQDTLAISNGISSVYIVGYASQDDEETCLSAFTDRVSQVEGVGNFAQATSDEGPLQGSGEVGTWAVYDLEMPDDQGNPVPLSTFLLCRAIVPGEVMIEIMQVVPTESYDAELDQLIQILNSVTPPDETAPPPTPESTTSTNGTSELMSRDEVLQFLDRAAADVDGYWERVYPTLTGGQEYTPPADYVMFDARGDSACGPYVAGKMGGGDGPFYCPPDQTIYLDVLFLEDQMNQYGLFPVAEAIAHEVGHHVQRTMGIESCNISPCLDPSEVTSQELEVMADCFAGAWSKDAELRGRLGRFDIERNIVNYVVVLGDPVSAPGDPGAHGRGALRVYWFLEGYYNGAASCFEASPATANRLDDVAAVETPAVPGDEPESETKLVSLEEPFTLGDHTVTVSGVETSRVVGGGSGDTVRAEGMWLVVYLDVEAGDATPLDYEDLTLQDADGGTYEPDLDATNAMLVEGLPDGVDTEFEPGETYFLAVVFDVPDDAAGFTLHTADDSVIVNLED